jgi:hypothetical protein
MTGASASQNDTASVQTPPFPKDRNLDLALLRELAGSAQHPRYMPALVDCFRREGGQLLRDLRDTFHRGDIAQSRALLHRLKGMSSSIGALTVARLCHQTLATPDTQLKGSGGLLIDKLSSVHREAGDALDRFLAGSLLLKP